METRGTSFIDAMDVSRGGAIKSNLGEFAVSVPDMSWLGVKRSIIDAGIVNTYIFRQVREGNDHRQ